MWVFGYGSLVWKADFRYVKRICGYIKGYSRRFWQYSPDHRGIPEKPGRVVTLIKSTDPEVSNKNNYLISVIERHGGKIILEKVWGAAYEIAEEDVDFVMQHLDIRECGGYEKLSLIFYPSDENVCDITEPFELMVYVGTSENKWYAGAADIDTIAKTVISSCGKSGPNVEYVYKLADAMHSIAPEVQDEHLFSLEETVRQLMAEQKS